MCLWCEIQLRCISRRDHHLIRSYRMTERFCAHCQGPVALGKRAGTIWCSDRCRAAVYRARTSRTRNGAKKTQPSDRLATKLGLLRASIERQRKVHLALFKAHRELRIMSQAQLEAQNHMHARELGLHRLALEIALLDLVGLKGRLESIGEALLDTAHIPAPLAAALRGVGSVPPVTAATYLDQAAVQRDLKSA